MLKQLSEQQISRRGSSSLHVRSIRHQMVKLYSLVSFHRTWMAFAELANTIRRTHTHTFTSDFAFSRALITQLTYVLLNKNLGTSAIKHINFEHKTSKNVFRFRDERTSHSCKIQMIIVICWPWCALFRKCCRMPILTHSKKPAKRNNGHNAQSSTYYYYYYYCYRAYYSCSYLKLRTQAHIPILLRLFHFVPTDVELRGTNSYFER